MAFYAWRLLNVYHCMQFAQNNALKILNQFAGFFLHGRLYNLITFYTHVSIKSAKLYSLPNLARFYWAEYATKNHRIRL